MGDYKMGDCNISDYSGPDEPGPEAEMEHQAGARTARRLRRERDNWQDTARQHHINQVYYRGNQLKLQRAIRDALNELGVASTEYPANVANAIDVLRYALGDVGIVDGYAVHADDCPASPCTCAEPDDEVQE